MTRWNPDEAARLAAELREDDQRASPARWIGGADCVIDEGDVVVAETDGPRRLANAIAIARLRNNAPAAAGQLEAARVRIDDLEQALNDALAYTIPGDERDRLVMVLRG